MIRSRLRRPDVEVDDDCSWPRSEAGTDSGAGGGLTHTTLAGCNHENLGQGVSPLKKVRDICPAKNAKNGNGKKLRRVSKYPLKTVMFNTSPDRLTCTRSPAGRAQVFATLYWPAMETSSALILLAENARLGVAFDPASQGGRAWAVYMDVAIGEKFRAGLTEEVTTRSPPWA
jgi:hypothetical protein